MALPLVVMLIVGMVSAGIAYNHQLSLTHAAREGGRYAATLPVTNFTTEAVPLYAYLRTVINQTVADGTGSLDLGVPGLEICAAYVSPGSDATDRTAHLTFDNGGFAPAVVFDEDCHGDLPPVDPEADRRVQVVVMRDADFNALVFSTTLTLDSSAENRFEAGVGLG